MARLGIFIDGAYLDYVLRDQFGNARIDYHKLSTEITKIVAESTVGGIDLLRTYYYHCLPYQSNPPTADESQRFSRMRSFLSTLERLPRYEVRLGRLAYRGNRDDGARIFEQKRVDMLLGVDLALLSGKGQITHAVLLAGDSDFLPAVIAAKPEGVLLWLVHGKDPHHELWDSMDERTLITQALIQSVLR